MGNTRRGLLTAARPAAGALSTTREQIDAGGPSHIMDANSPDVPWVRGLRGKLPASSQLRIAGDGRAHAGHSTPPYALSLYVGATAFMLPRLRAADHRRVA